MTTPKSHPVRTIAAIFAISLFAASCQTTGGGTSTTAAPIVDQVALLKKKQAEARTQVRGIMDAASAMAAKGNPRGAILHYQTAIEPVNFAEDSALKTDVLDKITALTGRLSAPPAIPAEARRFGIRGETLLQGAKDASAFKRAAKELTAAVDAAPWWSSAYYNLALAQEGALNAAGAIQAYKHFLAAEPNAQEARTISDHMIALEVVAEEQARTRAWNGYWRSGSGSLQRSELKNGVFTMVEVEVSDKAKKAGYHNGQVVFSGTLNGDVVTGTTVMPQCFEGAHWACKRCFPGFQNKKSSIHMKGPDTLIESYDDTFMDRFNTNNCAILATKRVSGDWTFKRDHDAERNRPGS